MSYSVLGRAEAFRLIQGCGWGRHPWYSNRAVAQYLPVDGKFVYAVGEAIVLERHFVERHGELEGGNASQQRVKHNLQLGTGELLTDALVPAVAEAELLPDVTGQVQLLGFGICGAVPVRGRQVDDDAVAGPDGLAADLDVLDGNAPLSVLDD